MINKKILLVSLPLLILLLSSFSDKKNSPYSKTSIQDTTYEINSFRIRLPINNFGVLGLGHLSPESNGFYDGKKFLFSGGFLLSGYMYPENQYGYLFANGVTTFRGIIDYQPGTVGMDPQDEKSKLYIVHLNDLPFSKSWQDWKNAVELGAEFYDGDNDGVYNPVDKNGNGKWDQNEDKPNIIGDFTIWCVYNDGVPQANRRITLPPLGIEIQQTIWGYHTINLFANSIFIRYKIIFKGNSELPNLVRLDSVIFSFVNDFDLGYYQDDLSGTDTLLQSVYGYNDGSDDEYGSNPPAVFAQLLQGPQAFIPGVTFVDNNNNGTYDAGDTPLTTAKSFIGPSNFKDIPGAINLNMTSSNTFRIIGYDMELLHTIWYLLNGLRFNGLKYDPCTHGVVVGGVNCNQVNPFFLFSGDPVTNKGWLQTYLEDISTLLNTGRFTLEKNKPVDLIVAYTIGRGTNSLNSISVARENAKIIQSYFQKNFVTKKSLPLIELKARTFENRVDVFWNTWEDFQFHDFIKIENDTALNLQFEQYELWAHNSPQIYYGPDTNRSKMIASFDVENEIENLYSIASDGISIQPVFKKGIQLNSEIFSKPERGKIIYTLDKNPFTGKALIKGEKLYVSLRKRFVNKVSHDLKALENRPGNYIIISNYDFGISEINSNVYEFIVGSDFNSPYSVDLSLRPGSLNATESKVVIDEVDKKFITDDEYSISFFRDTSASNKYSLFWRVKNNSKNQIVLDSVKVYHNLDDKPVIVDGLFPKIEWIQPAIKSFVYTPDSNKWYNYLRKEISGVFYMGEESVDSVSSEIRPLTPMGSKKSRITKVEDLREIEIRFGKTQKAYRFLSIPFGTRYISAASTYNEPSIPRYGEYFVEVPFQVWLKDERYNEERQLACGFIEARTNIGGNPDGYWDPGIDINRTREYIIIFNQSYDSTGRQWEYVGDLNSRTFADLLGWTPPASANFTPEQINRSQSPWFDALLVVGLERKDDKFFTSGDILTIPITYPLTTRDTFYYKSYSREKKLSIEERKSLVNKINVFPNPYLEYLDSRLNKGVITFSNLPEEVTIKIYTLSGRLIKTLSERNKISVNSPFIEWDLKNESGNRVADGVYLAYVKTKYGEKVLKFSIVKQKRGDL